MPDTYDDLWPEGTVPFSEGWYEEPADVGYWGQNATMRDFYDANPLDDGEMRLNELKFRVPPESISVDHHYSPTVMSSPTIRQPNSIKFASGKMLQAVTLSVVFPDQGDKEDLEESSLLDLIVLFKGAPFVAVQNRLLNETYGIGALALKKLSIETIPNFPNSYRAVLLCENFNWKVYVDSEDFASQINLPLYREYMERGRERYIEKSKQTLYEPPPFSNWEGESQGGYEYNVNEEWLNKNYDFDLKFITKAPVDVFYDTDAISSGDALTAVKEYLKDSGLADEMGLDLDSTDTYTIRDILGFLTGFGILSESGQVYGGDATGEPINFARVSDMLNYLLNYFNKDKINKLAAQLMLYDEDMDEATAKMQAAAYLAQIAFDEWARVADESVYGDPLYTPKPPWGDETTLKLESLNLSQAVTVNGIGVQMTNMIASLPIQMAEGNALQYMGADDTYVQVSLLLHGEGPGSDLSKLISAFRLQQAIVRATKSVVCTGFIGMDSPLTILCGMKTFLPVSLRTSTVQGYPGVYLVTLQLVDFDMYQQSREELARLSQQDELASTWAGHPSLRMIDQDDKFNLYPDLYLKHTPGVGWEQPDFYFIATPQYLPSQMVSNQNLAVTGLGGSSLDLSFAGDKTVLTVNGQTVPMVSDVITAPGGTPQGPGATQNNEDVDFGKNLAESYKNYASSNLRGYMRQAFPTFFFALIDEPRQILMYKTYTDFYSRRGVSQITVNRSADPTQEIAIIQLSDIYRRLSFDPEPKIQQSVYNAAWWASTLYKDAKTLFNMFGANLPIEAVELQPGMRVHLRMGFSNKISELRTVFNGTITEINPQSEGRDLTLTAQGDGRELLGVINASDKGHDTADVSGLFYSEPRELIIRLLTMRSSVWRNALSLMSGGAWHPDPKNGIRHFGELLPYEPGFEEGTELAEEKKVMSEEFKKKGMDLIGEYATNMSQNVPTAASGTVAIEDGKMNLGELESENIEVAIDNSSLLDALGKAIEHLWYGWDQNIFSRNIYPGTGTGLLEDFTIPAGWSPIGVTTTAQYQPEDAIRTGGGGGSVWDRMMYALADTFDFMSAVDEPSFKAYTYMRTVWDIIQQCSDIVPNYITAVRPFMHRSTLYYGKPFWKYTSGVSPVPGGLGPNNPYFHELELTGKIEDVEKVAARLGYYRVRMVVKTEKADTETVEIPNLPLGTVAEGQQAQAEGGGGGAAEGVNSATGYAVPPGGWEGSGSGEGGNVSPSFINSTFGAGKLGSMSASDGRSMAQVLIDSCNKYNVPWELAMSMIKFECSYMGPADKRSFRNNNPGNLNFMDWEASRYGAVLETGTSSPRFGKFPTMEAGIDAMCYLLGSRSSTYRQGCDMILAGDYEGGMAVIGNVYYPKQENPTASRNVQQANYMKNLASQAQSSGYSTPRSGSGSGTGEGTAGIGGVIKPDVPLPKTQGQNASSASPEAFKYAQKQFEGTNYTAWQDKMSSMLNNNEWWEKVRTKDWDEEYEDGTPRRPFEITPELNDIIMDDAAKYVTGVLQTYFTEGSGAMIFDWWLQTRGKDPNTDDITQDDWNKFTLAAVHQMTEQNPGLHFAYVTDENGNYAGLVATDSEGNILGDGAFDEWMNTWQNRFPEGVPDADDGGRTEHWPVVGWLMDKFKDFEELVSAVIQAIGNVFGKLKEFVSGVMHLGVALTKQIFTIAQIAAYMSDLSKIMNEALYDSQYQWGTIDNPFSREFGEPVLEVREPFCKFHKCDSLHNIIMNNISVSDAEVFPVVTSVSKGKKGKTVYADKSISPEFQKEMVYENSLNFDLLNWRDGVHAKRIGLAACARSLRTMYQGSVDMIGDNTLEPWDLLYIADVYTNMWGSCHIREVTHNMAADTGYISQVAVMPIVAVDDPAQWAVSTVANDFFKRIFNMEYDAEASARYYGKSDVDAALSWLENNPDQYRPLWYDIYVGAGLTVSIALLVAAIALTGGSAAAGVTGGQFMVGTMGATGLGGLLQPETMAGLVQYFDEQQDVWISLLTKNGEPYQAGLTGSTGIVVGRQKSVGLDILDLFSRDQPILTIDELLKRMGMTDTQIVQWQLDLDYFRTATLVEVMTQDFLNTLWNPPSEYGGKYIVWQNATVSRIIDGDTIEVTYNGKTETIRLAGIDAPELDHDNPGSTPKGLAAQDYLAGLIPVGSEVQVYIHPQIQKEKYGRWIGFVVHNNKNTSADMLLGGAAQMWGGTE